MLKKILFWLYVVGGPAAVIFLTFKEALWPRMIPFDYLFTILIGMFSYMITVIVMTNKKLNIIKNKVLYIFMPPLVYIGLLPTSFLFRQHNYNLPVLIRFLLFNILIYTFAIHVTVLIYNHWIISKENHELSYQASKKLRFPRTIKFLRRTFKISTISFLMFILPFVGFAVVLIFSSEWRIRYEIYSYNEEPSSENLAKLTIDLINYRSYEERITYLPLALKDDEVLKLIYELREDSGRADLYGMESFANLSSIRDPEDAKALVMTQYLNAYLLLGRNQEFLNLMLTNTVQYGEIDFYYLFAANYQLYRPEYKTVLPYLLVVLEQVYDVNDEDYKTLLLRKMMNIRVRQTIYAMQDDQENEDRLEVVFKQLFDELKTYNNSLED